MGDIQKISEAEAFSLIADLLDEDAELVSANTELDALEGWDSMGALMIMAEMDERFELTITEEQFEAMTHPSDMIELLRSSGCISDS